MNIPSEILIQIFQHFVDSPSDLFHCALQCRAWSYYALQLLWHKPLILNAGTLIKFQNTLSKHESSTFIPYASLIRRINLSAVAEYIYDDSLNDFSVCKHLDRVTLTGCSNMTDNGIAMLFSKNAGQYLSSIDLSDIKNITDKTVFSIARSCPNLQGLNISIRLSNWRLLTDASVIALTTHCPLLLEIDLVNCGITNNSLKEIFAKCRELRELKVNYCNFIDDHGFTRSALATPYPANTFYYDQLRVLDVTNILMISDLTLDCITKVAPKIRNLVLNKCMSITDKSLEYISRLGRHLHYLHLGSCRNITDDAVINLTIHCNRMRYIDLASCNKLGDDTVAALAKLPKLRRIGLVRCDRITDRAIMDLTRYSRTSISLERIHLSYCQKLSINAISTLVIHCRRLTHLSLSFIPVFQNPEFQRFCRPAPKEYTPELQRTFCVFSGVNVDNLRRYFKSRDITQYMSLRMNSDNQLIRNDNYNQPDRNEIQEINSRLEHLERLRQLHL
ncbi:hypothetical protein BDB01DRAFT_876424 [Pilobolus umbonatus]|nr:hypothetical protein BDB01DRAFT_876424 [Pilobolus umbonatus]